MPKQGGQVYCANDDGAEGSPTKLEKKGSNVTVRVVANRATVAPARHQLIVIWMMVAFGPWFLQLRSFIQLMMPHKISQDLVAGNSPEQLTNLTSTCPVEGLLIAGAWWNVYPTHFTTPATGLICHFVVPQYNIHGAYHLGTEPIDPEPDAPPICGANHSVSIDYYFYHGSIGYYSFYEEGEGTFCIADLTAYVYVGKLSSVDLNGKFLAHDGGSNEYRQSYYYGLVGVVWIMYRAFVLRRSFLVCRRYAQRCLEMREPLRMSHAVIFVQESARLAPHGARNWHRAAMLYMLVEGLMGDLFLLIAKDGALAKVQYISLGYNISSVLSILFEMVESMHWKVLAKSAQSIKRLLFNYETAMVGELLCAAGMQAYLTALNRSDLRDSHAAAAAVSYYIWSLVGHGIIVLGLAAFILTVRVVGALVVMQLKFGSAARIVTPCCVDSALGVRSKMISLSSYAIGSHGKMYYTTDALKAFGLLKMTTEDGGTELLVMHRLNWTSASRDDLIAIASISGSHAEPCSDRKCRGVLAMCDSMLGGQVVPPRSDEVIVDLETGIQDEDELDDRVPLTHEVNSVYI